MAVGRMPRPPSLIGRAARRRSESESSVRVGWAIVATEERIFLSKSLRAEVVDEGGSKRARWVTLC